LRNQAAVKDDRPSPFADCMLELSGPRERFSGDGGGAAGLAVVDVVVVTMPTVCPRRGRSDCCAAVLQRKIFIILAAPIVSAVEEM
jgi:hypothetical protein